MALRHCQINMDQMIVVLHQGEPCTYTPIREPKILFWQEEDKMAWSTLFWTLSIITEEGTRYSVKE